MSETQEVIGHQQKTEDVCPSEIEPKDKDVSLEKEPKIESPKETMPETNSEIEKQGEKEQPKEQQQQQQPPPQQQQQQPPPDERIKSPTNDVAASRRSAAVKKPMSPFAKFRQLDRQNSGPLSSPSTPKTPSTPGTPGSKAFSFKFTDPVVQNNAALIKERLLGWCQAKTKEYENVQIVNFSTSWNNGLAFCALLHHFRPEAFDYNTLKPENRKANFELAFTKAEEIADITPLLDVEDMVIMQRPDWKCVFTYVQSIYRRFKDED